MIKKLFLLGFCYCGLHGMEDDALSGLCSKNLVTVPVTERKTINKELGFVVREQEDLDGVKVMSIKRESDNKPEPASTIAIVKQRRFTHSEGNLPLSDAELALAFAQLQNRGSEMRFKGTKKIVDGKTVVYLNVQLVLEQGE